MNIQEDFKKNKQTYLAIGAIMAIAIIMMLFNAKTLSPTANAVNTENPLLTKTGSVCIDQMTIAGYMKTRGPGLVNEYCRCMSVSGNRLDCIDILLDDNKFKGGVESYYKQ